MNGRPPAQRPVGPATDAQQSSSSSSSSSLGWLRRSGGAVGAGDALGVSTGGGGAGFGTAAGCAGGVAGAGTRGAATIVRGSGADTVLAAVEELGGSLGFATENETATAGLGGGSPRGSSLIAMTAIPTMTPRELAATPAATSRNMTIYRLVMGHAPPVYARAAAPAVPCGTERAKVAKRRVAKRRVGKGRVGARGSSLVAGTPRYGLAVVHHERPYGVHSAGTPSEVPSECLSGRNPKWIALIHEPTAASHGAHGSCACSDCAVAVLYSPCAQPHGLSPFGRLRVLPRANA